MFIQTTRYSSSGEYPICINTDHIVHILPLTSGDALKVYFDVTEEDFPVELCICETLESFLAKVNGGGN